MLALDVAGEGETDLAPDLLQAKAGRDLANVVLEKANGSRFRIVTTIADIEDALEVARR